MTILAELRTPIFAAEGILRLNRNDFRLQVKMSPERILTLLDMQRLPAQANMIVQFGLMICLLRLPCWYGVLTTNR